MASAFGLIGAVTVSFAWNTDGNASTARWSVQRSDHSTKQMTLQRKSSRGGRARRSELLPLPARRARLVVLLLTVLAWSCLGLSGKGIAAQLAPDSVQAQLYQRLATTPLPPYLVVAGEHIRAPLALLHFYQRRAYQPAWTAGAVLLPQGTTLLAAIEAIDQEGLQPADYHLKQIRRLLSILRSAPARHHASRDLDAVVDLDLLLTDAFFLYTAHLLAGRIDPETDRTEWQASRRKIDLVSLLEHALATNQVVRVLRTAAPSHPLYVQLRQALAHYREIAAAGGWATVPDCPTLSPGDRAPCVPHLRARLRAEGFLASDRDAAAATDQYDDTLARAVRRFQRRYGLSPDAIVGPATRAALNVPATARARQIALNLERLRWLPRELPPRALVINIAGFSLEAWEHGRPVWNTRIVVGKEATATPVFSAPMTHLVLNPEWHLPHSIATKELLPRIRRNPNYLTAHRIQVLQRVNGKSTVIDPRTVNWRQLSAEYFPYRLRQEPGPTNSLGRIKFMLPNPFNIYLHDTPPHSRHLFENRVRTFSHGCIRVEEPLELATYVLRENPQWTQDTLVAALDRGTRRTVRLTSPLPVHIVYWTAWVDQEGVVQFRPDIYGYDTRLEKALRKPPPFL
ncbi:MAG: L,D-transpeptidase family protein [Candidatus Binatia bacterium]|nr:L,D-transpeptidase family protein [Candidatus Binatia bacterium]